MIETALLRIDSISYRALFPRAQLIHASFEVNIKLVIFELQHFRLRLVMPARALERLFFLVKSDLAICRAFGIKERLGFEKLLLD